MKKGLAVFLIFIVVLIIGIIGVSMIYRLETSPVKTSSGDVDKEYIRVEIEEGMGISQIAELLEEKGVIRNSDIMKVYAKLNKVTGLQAGKYDLTPEEDMVTIIDHIVKGEIADDSVKITFVEGRNMRYIAKMISEKTNNTEDDVFKLLKNESYIDSLIEKYWFITDEVKQKDIYYQWLL